MEILAWETVSVFFYTIIIVNNTGGIKITLDNDILQYAITEGIIDFDDVQNKIRMKKREYVLKNHQYEIWQGKNGRWYTHLPDDTKKDGRRMLAKSTREKIEEAICEYYGASLVKNATLTLRKVYPLWMQSRKLEVSCMNTARKNDWDWRTYYLDDPIIDVEMEDLTEQMLKDWAHRKITENNFNKRSYYNMAIVMKKCFEFAKASRMISHNTWQDVVINTKKFAWDRKKENTTQIYFYDEQYKIIEYALSLFMRDPKNITALIIPFLFLTGLRCGEVVALKYEDITDTDIIIRQSESTLYDIDSQGKFSFVGQEIVPHAKTRAGERNVPLTKGAKKIIEMVKSASEEYGLYDDGFIFCPRSKRLKAGSVDSKLYRYCEACGIPKKSAHKIRKTYISRLINDCRIDLDTICRVAGHTDLKTTLGAYTFGLEQKEVIHDSFEKVLDISQSVTKCNQELLNAN